MILSPQETRISPRSLLLGKEKPGARQKGSFSLRNRFFSVLTHGRISLQNRLQADDGDGWVGPLLHWDLLMDSFCPVFKLHISTPRWGLELPDYLFVSFPNGITLNKSFSAVHCCLFPLPLNWFIEHRWPSPGSDTNNSDSNPPVSGFQELALTL